MKNISKTNMNKELYNELMELTKDQLIAGVALLILREKQLQEELDKLTVEFAIYKQVLHEKDILHFK